MASATTLLNDESLTYRGGELEVRFEIPWYRSLPLSCIERIGIAINGRTVHDDDMVAKFNSHSNSIKELRSLVSEFWFVQDEGQVTVLNTEDISTGDSASVTVELALRIPYVTTSPGNYFVQRVEQTKTLTVREAVR